ncbi:cAMP-regulated phosphoprotein 21-like isoform X2 [Oppia nitens]|uniref:cAMP-regulated phosphoprotein 21-like isoform X2 n=1 Tax=Oppia nitens TaxID=1686743 RepID=UPI0023DA62F6|nr:cAMP-regulated phosphoprotein 21-like isoform X2 [Oppia nitens]
MNSSGRRFNGYNKNSKKSQSSDQKNLRRLSKQEEIDLTVEGIDIKDEITNCNDNSISVNNCEPSVAPTIHVNTVEDKYDNMVLETEVNHDIDNNSSQTMHKSDSRQSLNTKQAINLSTNESIKERKRGKHLARAEALRDTSASPPPTTQCSDGEEKNCHSSSSQSQTNSVSQNNKNKMKIKGNSSGSLDRTSPTLSRDSSTENFSDLNGTDVQQFLMETLQKNKKDRVFLLKIEQELSSLVKDSPKNSYKFQQMTSYNRMLVHRVAALFGFDHNVDVLGMSVIVNKSKSTRIPEFKFKDYIKEDSLTEPKKLILKRDSASLDDGSNGSNVSFDGKEKSPDRSLNDNNRNKSFEEREERYEKARARIFNQGSSSSDSNDNISTATDNIKLNSNNHLAEEKSSSLQCSQTVDDSLIKSNNSTNCTELCDTNNPNDTKPNQYSTQNSSFDSTNASKSVSGKSNLEVESQALDKNKTNNYSKNRPAVTKASSFGGISRSNDNNHYNSTQTHLLKSGSLITTHHNANHSVNVSNRSNTPKNNTKTDNGRQMNNTIHHSEQRYYNSQQTSHTSNTSHYNRHNNWHQNSHSRNNNRMTSIGGNASGIQWSQMVNQNYPHMLLQQQQNDPNAAIKDIQFLQHGQQLFMTSNTNYGQQSVNNEPQQLMNHQPIRLPVMYSNPNAPQMPSNLTSFGPLLNNSISHQSIANPMNSLSFPIQSTSNGINFSNNQPPNNTLIPTSLNPNYRNPMVPSNVGNVGTLWIVGNGMHPQSTSPMMACPPPANTPPSAPIVSNIAPFVGVSYQQQYRPPMNTNIAINPNLPLNAAQNRPTAPLLKNQPMMTTHANPHRIISSNGNHYIHQSVPEMVDMNSLINHNNYANRGTIVPQVNQMRRMPLNSNQALDVRLMAPQTPAPYLLPTPQRHTYIPVSNTMSGTPRQTYDKYTNNSNQRGKAVYKNKSYRYNTNKSSVVVVNNVNANSYSHSNYSNT